MPYASERNPPAHTNVDCYMFRSGVALGSLLLAASVAVACSMTPGASGRTTPAPTNAASPRASSSPAPVTSPRPSSAGTARIVVELLAGPVCPVERNPPDPSCAARKVADTHVVLRDASGNQVGEGTSDGDGKVTFLVPGGDYVVESAAVAGLMGQAQPQNVTVADGQTANVVLSYDTGIR